jgi:hypothetical protein
MSTYAETKKIIIDSLEDLNKYYILINYSYNSDEKLVCFKEEFREKYINFYKVINEIDKKIDDNHYEDIGKEIKKIFNIDYYKSKMNFLDSYEFEYEDASEIGKIDKEYSAKTSTYLVKNNFSYHNKCEFGINTRSHINANNRSPINARPNNDLEEKTVFSALSTYFIENYLDKKNKKILTLKDMQ